MGFDVQNQPNVDDNPFRAPIEEANPFATPDPQAKVPGDIQPPDTSKIRSHIEKNLSDFHASLQDEAAPVGLPAPAPEASPFAADTSTPPIGDTGAIASQAPKVSGPTPIPQPGPDQKKPPTFMDAVEAGLQMSTTGMFIHGKPDFQLPRDAPAYLRIASQMSTMIGDGPEFLLGGLIGAGAGFTAGGVAGTVALMPGLGTAVGGAAGAAAGAGAGAFALPEALRSMLMQHYEKGDIKSFSDFWERASATFLDTLKQGALGAVTTGVGAGAGALLEPLAKPVVATAGVMASQIATMVGLGSAMEGKVPDASDFGDAAAVVLLMHGAIGVAKSVATSKAVPTIAEFQTPESPAAGPEAKMRLIYEKTGVMPAQIADQAGGDPLLRQELMEDGNKIPTAFQELVEKPQPKETAIPGSPPPIEPPKPVTPEVPETLTDRNPVLLTDGPSDKITIEPMKRSALDSERGAIGSAPPAPEPTTDLGRAQKDILDRVHSRPDFKGEPLSPEKLYENVVDGLDPFRRIVKSLVKGEVPASEDVYKLARLARNAVDKARAFIKFGSFDYNDLTKVTGPGLNKILEPFKSPEDRAGLTAFLVARRSIELEGKGITPGGWISESSKIVYESGKAKYGKAAQQLTDFENQALKYLKDSGRISEESFNKIKAESENHVPFHRITEDNASVGGGKKGPKRIKGSESDIVDPIESIVRNTHAYIQMAEENRATSALIEMTQASEEGRALVQRSAVKFAPQEVKPEEIAKYLQAHGIDEASPGVVEGFNIFRPIKQIAGEDQIVHWVDGKPQLYDVPADIARAFRAMDGSRPQMSLLLRLAKAPAAVLRGTLAYTPDFIMRHWIRNGVVSGTFSSSTGLVTHMVEQFHALTDLFPHGGGEYRQAYIDFLKSGGANGEMSRLDQSYIENNVWELSKKTGLIDSMRNLVSNPLRQLHALATLNDNASRLAEFKRTVGTSPTHADLFEGGYAAREVIPDPLRRGGALSVKAYDMITPFSNLRIQGLDKIIRAFDEDPKGMAIRMGAAITLPSVVLWAAHQYQMQSIEQTSMGDTYKERWENIPPWEKDIAWIIMTDRHTFRIPKPFEAGIVFGSAVERVLDKFFTTNPDAFKDFGGTLIGGATPNILPTVLSPFVDHFANKSTFTGHNLVPAPLEKLLPQDQATPYTSETAKIVGGVLQKFPVIRDFGTEHLKITSPMVLENYVRAWTGNLGNYALQVSDKMLISAGVVPDPVKPMSHIEEYPFIKAFMIKNPSMSAEPIQDFYDNYNAHATMIAHQKFLVAKGDTASLRKDFGPDQLENREKLVSLDGFKQALTAQNAMIQKTMQNPKMSPNDKRQIIDTLTWGMIREATAANKLLRSLHDKTSLPKPGVNP